MNSVVHPSDDYLLLENKHSHRLAFNAINNLIDYLPVPYQIHLPVTARHIYAVLNIELPCSLHKARH